MLRITDTIAGDPIEFRYIERKEDLTTAARFVASNRTLGIDTESTGLNCYKPGWQLRSVQIGNDTISYVIPARFRRYIGWLAERDIQWIGHNGPHDWRSIDAHLGYETGGHCIAETYLPAHHTDPRNAQEGGTGLGLKALAEAHIDPDAGKWERALKKAFKEIRVPVPGKFYKAKTVLHNKGDQFYRTITLDEGWALIDPRHPAYIAYSAADPLLTYRLWQRFLPVAREQNELYRHDWRIQEACDRLERRGIRLDIPYTMKLSAAYTERANEFISTAVNHGIRNINSTAQIIAFLTGQGVKLTARTKSGKSYSADDKTLRGILKRDDLTPAVETALKAVLGAKQLLKRRESYTEAFLAEVDANGRVHASINSLAARTARMSISRPPLQQLPTKNRESDE